MRFCKTRASSQKKGRKYYKTNTPCVRGHITTRYTSTGRCTKCDKIHTRGRRVAIALRTPPWACLNTIKAIYDSVSEGYSVDHDIPLRGELVSGLHVPDNLVVIPIRENLSKSNQYTI